MSPKAACFKKTSLSLMITLVIGGLTLWKDLSLHSQNTGNTIRTGIKYFKNYTPQEYGGHNQTWAVLEDKRGIIYVANNSGIKEFDGVSWRHIDVPHFTVYSLALAENGTIYASGKDEFGFLAPSSTGTMEYHSLVNHLPRDKQHFGDVWKTHWTKQGIYFRTAKILFRWDPDTREIKVWNTNTGFVSSFTHEGRYFIRQQNIGLMQMETGTDTLTRIAGGEFFAEKKVYMMARYDSHKLLLGTRAKGFFLHDYVTGTITPFPTAADDYLLKNEPCHGIRLSCGAYALATLRGGLVIMDAHGRVKDIFNRAYGLQNEKVWYVFQDSSGNLWLCLDKGITKIEYHSPLSTYDEESGLPANVQAVVKHQDRLYAGTSGGLFFLAAPRDFQPVPGISSSCWNLLSRGNSLLAGTDSGVIRVGINNHKNQTLLGKRTYVLVLSAKDTNRTWVGTLEGLVSLYLDNHRDQWEKEFQSENITQEIRTIVEDPNGNLWLGTLTQGVIRVEFPGGKVTAKPGVTRFSTGHGLPEGTIRVHWAAGRVIFATNRGIYRYEEKNNVFIPDGSLGEEFAGGEGGKGVFLLVEDRNKNIWFNSHYRNIRAEPLPPGALPLLPQPGPPRFGLEKEPFLRMPRTQVNAIYPDPHGDITWFAANDGLFRYDTTVKKDYRRSFQTLIRKVLVNGKPVYDGCREKINKARESESLYPIIAYKDRNLRFEFAAPFFEAETNTGYRCFLQGYEKEWSAWSPETWKDYTNLDAGMYTFRVRAKNVYENVGSEAVFPFRVLPPWYKTWWAAALYVLAGLLVLFLVVEWRAGQLQREKLKLEQIVKERTKEIKEKNIRLEEQSEKLKELDKMKSRFFANISHEFRTPLTLIMGPLDRIRGQSRDQEMKKQLGLVYRSAQRLLGLINQLLDLSRFESGKMKLAAKQEDLVPFLKGILETFETMAARKHLALTSRWAAGSIPLFFDREKLEKIFINLLSNACKFTPAHGRIMVSVFFSNAANEVVEMLPSAGGFVSISVKDNGPGIPADQLTHIFDRFYQADITVEHRGKGSGIGLALVKELVELHHGEISVTSEVGENSGTEFILRLPLGSDFLAGEEMAEAQKSCDTPLYEEEMPPLSLTDTLEAQETGDVSALNNQDVFQWQAEMAAGKNIILVVEDSADMRHYIRLTLEPDYTVAEAINGREGIAKARDLVPDLIISDIMMPEVDGYELCRTVKSDLATCHIPVVLLTAKASEENVIRGLETRADDYITKPFNPRVLCARIRNLIELRRQLQLKLNRNMVLQPSRLAVADMDREFLTDLQGIIEEHLGDPEFNVEDLSKRLYMSRTTVYRKILALSGEPPTDFIRSYRLMRAAQLLKSRSGTVTEVAFEVGFTSRAYFTRCFKEKFHRLPSEYSDSESA